MFTIKAFVAIPLHLYGSEVELRDVFDVTTSLELNQERPLKCPLGIFCD
jgi:hypothetical protein